jgi:hypothetical protein
VSRARIGVVVLLALLLGGAARHEWLAGRTAMQESRAALALGKTHPATVAARRAAEAAVPGSPYAEQGYEELAILARAAEAEGRLADAAFAWRAMRSSAEATWPARAARGRVAEAEAGILRIAASSASLGRNGATPGANGAPEGVLRRELAKSDPPTLWLPSTIGWALALLLFFLAPRLARPSRGPIGESPV